MNLCIGEFLVNNGIWRVSD